MAQTLQSLLWSQELLAKLWNLLLHYGAVWWFMFLLDELILFSASATSALSLHATGIQIALPTLQFHPWTAGAFAGNARVLNTYFYSSCWSQTNLKSTLSTELSNSNNTYRQWLECFPSTRLTVLCQFCCVHIVLQIILLSLQYFLANESTAV